MDIKVPNDVTEHVRRLFSTCNDEVSTEMCAFPAMREETLDTLFISRFARGQAPKRLPSNWIVRIDTHFIGGGHHYGAWEVADIALMMVFRKNGIVIRSKIALLQSKKLYPNTLTYNPEDWSNRSFGLGSMMVPKDVHEEIITDRVLQFKNSSRYGAFKKNDNQQDTMGHFERRWDTEMYYLFYNPLDIPFSVKTPVVEIPEFPANIVGSRVIPKSSLDSALAKFPDGYVPSYEDVAKGVSESTHVGMHESGWRLEDFAADFMLACKEGLIDDSENFESIAVLANQKRRPISAAVSITFEIE